MGKRKYKKEDAVLVDLSERRKIQVIPSSPSQVTDEEMEEFENRLINRYNNMKEFSDHYISYAFETKKPISDDDFEKTMKEMLKRHKLLRSIIKEQEN